MGNRTREKQWNVNLTIKEYEEIEKTILWLGFDSRTAFVISLIHVCRSREFEELLKEYRHSRV